MGDSLDKRIAPLRRTGSGRYGDRRKMDIARGGGDGFSAAATDTTAQATETTLRIEPQCRPLMDSKPGLVRERCNILWGSARASRAHCGGSPQCAGRKSSRWRGRVRSPDSLATPIYSHTHHVLAALGSPILQDDP